MCCKSTVIYPQVKNVEIVENNNVKRFPLTSHVDFVDNNHFCKTLKKRRFHKSTKSTCLFITDALCESQVFSKNTSIFFS